MNRLLNKGLSGRQVQSAVKHSGTPSHVSGIAASVARGWGLEGDDEDDVILQTGAIRDINAIPPQTLVWERKLGDSTLR